MSVRVQDKRMIIHENQKRKKMKKKPVNEEFLSNS